MKLKKFYFAALAATMIASCSNEQDIEAPGSINLKPGEALVTFDVRGNISRATDEQESAIKSLVYKVYKTNGDSITINRLPGGTPSMIKFKIPSDIVEVEGGNIMRILVAVNSTSQLNYTYDNAMNAMEDKDLNGEFANAKNGLPASASTSFMLQEGAITIPNTTKAKRIVSRIYVKKDNTTTGNISGATIQLKKVANEGYLFKDGYVTGGTTSTTKYTVVGEIPQPVAYVYPTPTTNNATIEIALNGKTKSFPISTNLDKNKSYAINIKAGSSTGEAAGEWDITFESWDNSGSIDADFTNPTTPTVDLNPTYTDNKTISVENGKLAVKVYGTSEINPTDLFNGNVVLTGVGSVTSKANALDTESADKVVQARVANGKLVLTVKNTTVGQADKNYEIILNATVDGTAKSILLPIVAKGYPKNFSAIANGIEVMTVGLQAKDSSDPTAIIDIVNEINKESGSTFAQQSKTYMTANATEYAAKELKLMGVTVSANDINDGTVKCPAGFKVPTQEEIKQLFGWKRGPNTGHGINIDTKTELTEDILGNYVLVASQPTRHWFFTPKTGDELFIPAAVHNPLGGGAFFNYIFTYENNGVGRFIFSSTATGGNPQLRVGLTGSGSTTCIRCVRDTANQ